MIFGEADPDAGGFTKRNVGECAQNVKEADVVPVDLYVMFDQSKSMSTVSGAGSRLDAVRAAVADFMRDPKSEGLSLGIGYFGQLPIGATSCDPADYATPDVPIAPLPGAANSVLSSLNAIEPTGETPTGAAIRGACEYTSSYQAENPDNVVAILLVTDGEPEAPSTLEAGGTCSPTIEDAAQAATSCADEGIPTYVLGVGYALSNLDQIAAAGGTTEAHLVEGENVSEEVLAALSAIRGDVIPCELEIPEPPDGKTLDYSTLNVEYTSGSAEPEVLYNVPGAADCGAEGGWYYDDGRQHVLLCETTCNRVSSDPAGTLDYALGCEEILTLR